MGNGNFIIGKCIYNPEDVEINNAIMRKLCRIIDEISGLEKWQFILEDQKMDEKIPHYVLSFISTEGLGSCCAVEKMNTLRNRPYVSNTNDMKGYNGLGEDEVSWYGGVQIPYTGYEDPSNLGVTVSGVVRLAFSGARESIDLAVVLEVLKEYIEVCNRVYPEVTYLYDFELLKNDQLSGYLMKKIF